MCKFEQNAKDPDSGLHGILNPDAQTFTNSQFRIKGGNKQNLL